MSPLNAQTVADAYVNNPQATATSIATEFGCSADYVRAVCRVLGVKMRRGMPADKFALAREKAQASIRQKALVNGLRRLIEKHGADVVLETYDNIIAEAEQNDVAAD